MQKTCIPSGWLERGTETGIQPRQLALKLESATGAEIYSRSGPFLVCCPRTPAARRFTHGPLAFF